MYPTHQKARPRQEIGGCKEGEFKIQNSKFKIQNSTDAAEQVQRTSLLGLCRAARRKHHPCGGVKFKIE